MPPMNILVVLGSVRQGRIVERVGKLATKTLEAKGAKPIIMDPVALCKYEMVQQPLHFLPSPDQAPAWMKTAHDMILKADGFLVLASEYNCGIPPALPNLLNSFPPPSYKHKPCGIVTYSMGPFAGMRTLTLVRPFLHELGLVTLPTYVPIPTAQNLINEKGQTSEKMVTDRMDQAVQELLWYAEGLKKLKSSSSPPT